MLPFDEKNGGKTLEVFENGTFMKREHGFKASELKWRVGFLRS